MLNSVGTTHNNIKDIKKGVFIKVKELKITVTTSKT